MELSAASEKIKTQFGNKILCQNEFRGEVTLSVEAGALVEVLAWAKTNLGFDYLADISAVDHMGASPRFEVVYELYSMKDRIHLRVKTAVEEDAAEVDTASQIWPTANWHEREVWDLMGIRFRNHPDLRRILMWEGYPYHPLRKDFPLGGLPTDLPEVAFTETAPLAGGPFVTAPIPQNAQAREPRSRSSEVLP